MTHSPIPNNVYSFNQIVYMDLSDIPMLVFDYKDKEYVVHTSNTIDADLLKIPGFGESWWQYKKTTSELIPIFLYVDEIEITKFVDIIDVDDSGYMAIPKCSQRLSK